MPKKMKPGRKRLPDEYKAILVGFYVKKALVTSRGGLQKVRESCKDFVENREELWVG